MVEINVGTEIRVIIKSEITTNKMKLTTLLITEK